MDAYIFDIKRYLLINYLLRGTLCENNLDASAILLDATQNWGLDKRGYNVLLY